MGSLLIIDGCFYDPYAGFEIIGLFLVVLMIVLIIRQKRKTKNAEVIAEAKEPISHIFIEKDVLGLDKTYINSSEPNYKTANKFQLKFILIGILFMVSLFMFLIYTPKKKAPYRGSVNGGTIHHPDDKYNWFYNPFDWFYSDEDVILKDTLFPPAFREKDVFKNVDEQAIKKEIE